MPLLVFVIEFSWEPYEASSVPNALILNMGSLSTAISQYPTDSAELSDLCASYTGGTRTDVGTVAVKLRLKF